MNKVLFKIINYVILNTFPEYCTEEMYKKII